VIVAEAASFPTDLYMIEGAMRCAPTPCALRLLGRDGERLETLLDQRVAAVVLSHVDYRTGALLDAAEATRLVHDAGALVIWDVCHSVGVVPIAFEADAMDFAVGCTYKYLCAGPGAPGFIAVAHKHLKNARQPLSGWWGHASPFAFERSFRPDPGLRRFLCGTQPILSMLGVACALDALDGCSVTALRQKSLALTALFIARVETLLPNLCVLTPRDPAARGSQVSLAFANAFSVVQALIAQKIIGDFRAPDVMRFGLAPCYLRYQDVWDATEALAACLRSEEWRAARFSVRTAVT
jgi:kynureninase